MSNERIESASKLLAMLSDLAKFIGVSSLAFFAVAAIAAPEWTQKRLDALGWQIKEVNAGFFRITVKETVKAGNGVIRIAEGLTNTEISLAALQASLPKGPDASQQNAEILRAMSSVKAAQLALGVQADALASTGKAVGLIQDAPDMGWLYVGIFAANNDAKYISPRISPNGIQRAGGAITGILLKYDTVIVSNGDDCTKTSLKDVPMPDPNAPEREFTIVTPSESKPLEVIKVSECPSIGDGKLIYAQVRIPTERVRFSQLSKIKQ